MTCPRELRNADIAVQPVGNAVAVDVTARAGQGNELRTKARAIADEYRSMEERAESEQEGDAAYRDPNRSTARENEELEAMRELIAKVAIHDIEGGVRVLFTPKTGKAQELQRELTADATDLDNGNCPKPLRNMRSAESEHDASPKAGFSSPRDRVSSEATAPR